MAHRRILLTNDDGWDAPGLAALKELASQFGEVLVLAPCEQHSYCGHRATGDRALNIFETGPNEFRLNGTPADCVRIALTELFPDVDWVLAGINRGGNLGADLYVSGTVAAAREAAFLSRPAIAISQYVRKGVDVDWKLSRTLAIPAVTEILSKSPTPKTYWNVNLPHLDSAGEVQLVLCEPDHAPFDIRYARSEDGFRYAGSYHSRPVTEGYDTHHCFAGKITISCLRL